MFCRNNFLARNPEMGLLTLYRAIAGMLVTFLAFGFLYYFVPHPVLREVEPAENTGYYVDIRYSATSHDNRVELFDEDNGIQSDTPYDHYILSSQAEEQLESILQTYEMRRTFLRNHSVSTYNITRFSERESFMYLFIDEDQSLVQQGSKWYRVTNSQGFFMSVSNILDRYVENCRSEKLSFGK